MCEDGLTGLLSWPGLQQAFEGFDSELRRRKARMACALLDLDDFRRLNVHHDRATGDAALRHFALVLKDRQRRRDRVARLGDDEFALLMTDTTEEDALRQLERIRGHLLRAPFVIEHAVYSLPFSAAVTQVLGHRGLLGTFEMVGRAVSDLKQGTKNRAVLVY